jgi:hypothetical protein
VTSAQGDAGTVLVWLVAGRNQLFDASLLLGYAGVVPFGAPPKDGSVIYTTTSWQIT